MRYVLVLTLFLTLVTTPAGAQQQDNKLEPPELDRYRRWGFLRARPGIALTRVGYDSNILSSSSGDVVSDYTATVSPKLDGLILLGSKGFLTLTEQFDYTLYLENSDQNFWSNSFSTRATVPFRKFGVFGEVNLDNLSLRPLDQEDIRTKTTRRTVGTGVILQPGWRTEIELGRYEDRLRYEDTDQTSVSARLDRDESRTDFQLSYRMRGRTKALLSVENSRIEFAQPFDTGSALVDRNVTGWQSLAGFSLGDGAPLVGKFLLGWSTIDAQDASLEDLSEMIGQVDATWVSGGRTRIRFRAERVPGFAVSEGNAYYLHTHGELRAIRFFSRFLGGELAYRRDRLDFPENASGTTRKDDTQFVVLGVRLRTFSAADGRRIEYSLKLGRYRRDSNQDAFDQDRNTFGFGVVVGF